MRREAPVTGSKICRGECGRELSVLAFASDSEHADGMKSLCRDCSDCAERIRGGVKGARPRRYLPDVMSLD